MDRDLEKKHDLRLAVRTLDLFYHAVKRHPLSQEILDTEKDEAVLQALKTLETYVSDSEPTP